ncbi:hypothetical protein AOQ84DRAFT_374989 [Glonium stellatum]|uniref:Uncharacterized protein n=1 Tax=Glonium stellatum TaxID=574774 RepID=A0A8E2F4M2_9PEZI|nr:hypothetical protein AOQ84DRAFT_374989 [Glonium stellatum]
MGRASRVRPPNRFWILAQVNDNNRLATDTNSGDSSNESNDGGSDYSGAYSESEESVTWYSYSSGSVDTPKRKTLVGYVYRFCNGTVENLGRMIARLSAKIHRKEKDIPENYSTDDESETEDELEQKREPESSDDESIRHESEDTDSDNEITGLLTGRKKRNWEKSFTARQKSEAALRRNKSQHIRRRYGRQEIVVTPSC